MTAPLRAPFTELVDLASARLGSEALAASDDFFAPAANLLKPSPAVFDPHAYTDRGKWMDGWESRRKRVPGHDWCVVRLGAPGIVHGAVVDTAHFLGNYPPWCWIEGAEITAETAIEDAAWHELVPRSPLRGGAEHLFPVAAPRRVTHVRLNIEPDGGVARLRVHGIVAPDWEALRDRGGLIDLASVLHGGTVVTCNDMFFGPKDNLILPGRAASMADGWETRRRREPGNDWIVLRLGRAGRVRRIEIDTAFFKGNYPESAALSGCRRGGAALSADAVRAGTDIAWQPILPRTRLEADHVHTFELEAGGTSVDHVRLDIYPDGGVSRLRVWCEPEWS